MGEQEAQPPTSPRKLLLLEIAFCTIFQCKSFLYKFIKGGFYEKNFMDRSVANYCY